MTDKEKALELVQKCLDDWPYAATRVVDIMKRLEQVKVLLKAQEAVSVRKKQMEMVGIQTWDWACGNCGQTVLFSANFCPWCGRAVKWE